jgi:hypothetical protein
MQDHHGAGPLAGVGRPAIDAQKLRYGIESMKPVKVSHSYYRGSGAAGLHYSQQGSGLFRENIHDQIGAARENLSPAPSGIHNDTRTPY